MAMLAELRRKQKWTLNPRGKHWSDDSNKFGQKMLEKMGWTSGKGLGANLDGMTEHIGLKYKNDQAGVGFSFNDTDKQWTQHQKSFNKLLQKLHNDKATETPSTESKLSGKSLELKSKQSGARVHYQKFTRGKDVNTYSPKDLANIFGNKDLEEKSQESEIAEKIQQEPQEPPLEPIGSSDISYGVVTIKGGSITDYFKNKMSALSRKVTTEIPSDSENESETHTGFNFSVSQIKFETSTKPLEIHFSVVNPALDLASPNEVKDMPRKRKSELVFVSPAFDVANPKESKDIPCKRKTDFVFNNPALEFKDGTPEMKGTPKRRKSEFAFENGGLDLEYPQNGETASVVLCPEQITKKKNQKKFKKEIPLVVQGLTNDALNLESRDDEILSSSEFEVSRACLGLANAALDLTDETNGRKRVTFNETIQYDTDVASRRRKKKRSKNGGKLDKFEVDNDKIKRKKKERNDEVVESTFVNEAMNVHVVSQEVNENAANEKKIERTRRRRDRRMPNLETITEAPEEEKESVVEVVTLDEANDDLEVLSLDIPKQKKKKKMKTCKTKKLAQKQQNKNVLTTDDTKEADVELVEETLSFDSENSDKKSKESKKIKEKNAVKKSKRKTKDSMAREREGMEVTVMQVEAVEKAEKETTKVVNEGSKEDMDTVVVENSAEVDSAKKKHKKLKKEHSEEDRAEKKRIVQDIRIEQDKKKSGELKLENDAQRPWDTNVKNSKRTFKALFARSPVVNFVGSNINEIKGYGMDLK